MLDVRGVQAARAVRVCDMKTGSRQYNCRVCHAAYRRAHYLANRPEYIRRAIAQVTVRRAQNRREIFAYLQAHECVDCRERDVLVLEFRPPRWRTKVEGCREPCADEALAAGA